MNNQPKDYADPLISARFYWIKFVGDDDTQWMPGEYSSELDGYWICGSDEIVNSEDIVFGGLIQGKGD